VDRLTLPRTTLTVVEPFALPVPPGRPTSFTKLKTAPYQHGGAYYQKVILRRYAAPPV